MAAAGLQSIWRNPSAVEMRRKSGLGTTGFDLRPHRRLVQVHASRRNAIASVKRSCSAQMALAGTVSNRFFARTRSFETMPRHPARHADKYKELRGAWRQYALSADALQSTHLTTTSNTVLRSRHAARRTKCPLIRALHFNRHGPALGPGRVITAFITTWKVTLEEFNQF